MTVPWAMRMQAIAVEEPGFLARSLTTVIVNCGGWVLSRGISDTGTVTLLFEFERRNCLEVYSGVVGAGIELSRGGHMRFTELCQCTRSGKSFCQNEIASVELEIQAYPLESTTQTHVTQGA